METMDKGRILYSKVLTRLQLSLRAGTHPLSLCLHTKFTIGINACYVSKRKTMFYPSSGLGHRNSTTVRITSTLFLSCGLLLMSWLNVPQAANLYYLFLLSQPNNWILVWLLVLLPRALQLWPLWSFLFSLINLWAEGKHIPSPTPCFLAFIWLPFISMLSSQLSTWHWPWSLWRWFLTGSPCPLLSDTSLNSKCLLNFKKVLTVHIN